MNISLRVRKTDSFGIETFFDLPREFPSDSPIVVRLDPGTAEQIDGRIRQLINIDFQSGIIKNQRMFAGDLFQHIDGMLDVIVVTDAKH